MTPNWGYGLVQVVAADQVLSREVDEELVLYHPATDKVTHLDAIAAQVWFRLESKVSVEALISGLVSDFRTDRSTISADVEKLLNELFEARLILVT